MVQKNINRDMIAKKIKQEMEMRQSEFFSTGSSFGKELHFWT